MNVFEIGIIVEMAVPNKKASQYKTEEGVQRFAVREIQDFVHSLTEFEGYEVGYTVVDSYEVTEINDFNYNYAYRVEKNQEYRVFRYFKSTIFVQSEETKLDLTKMAGLYWYEKNGYTFMIQTASLGRKKEAKSKSRFVEKTKRLTIEQPV